MRTHGIHATALEIHILTAIIAKTAFRALENRADLANVSVSSALSSPTA